MLTNANVRELASMLPVSLAHFKQMLKLRFVFGLRVINCIYCPGIGIFYGQIDLSVR